MKISKHLCAGAALLTMMLFSATAVSDEIKISFCDSCSSDGQFAQAGESAALSTMPFLTEGQQEALVINTTNETMRMIAVTRESISTTDGFGDEFWSTTSEVTYLDPNLKAQALDAIQGVKSFMADIQDENARDLDFGVVPIDSAADLLGTGDGADFVRDTFEQALNNRMTAGWRNQITWDILSFASRVANQYMGQTVTGGAVTVHFEDGTQVTVEIIEPLNDTDGDITFNLVVDTSTASGPGLTVIPSTLGAFLIAFGNGFSGSPDYIGNLGDLIQRGGGRVERYRTGGSCTGSVDCVDDGVDENGNPKLKCRLVLPKEELGC
ncbi:MAG: hypothetical protein R6V61_00190 [Wenzhouxiangellaceae bacterium]